jgi:DNA-binding NtrC family response regulator
VVQPSNESIEGLRGARVLIVEDDFLVASSLRNKIEGMGCEVVGPAPSVDSAANIVRQQPLDGAILDVNIIGGSSEPIARALTERKVPFFFITGYASPDIYSEDLRRRLSLRKPVDVDVLESTMRSLFLRHS